MATTQTVVAFGEAGKGEMRVAYFCQSLAQLSDNLGNPPEETQGLDLAIQALMYERNVIFFRVKEEGFSSEDYMYGLSFLQSHSLLPHICAICLPGVGSPEVLDTTSELCVPHKKLMVTTEADLYDYLTWS